MSKPTLPGQPNPMPTAATTTAPTAQGCTTSRVSFAPVATGAHAPPRSDWTRARQPTEQAGFSMGTDPRRIGRQPGKSSPIPVPQRNAQAQTWFSAAPANTVQSPHERHTTVPQPSQADSDSTTASDEEQIDVFQALDALNRSEKKEVTKDEQQIDLLEALEEQRRLQEKISVYQMLSESPPKAVNHPEKRPDEATTQPSARPGESALTPDRQRDKLFDAVRHGDTKHANWMVKELSFTNPLDRQLPAAIPDTFIQNTWTPAQRHFSKFSTPLQMYLTHCRQIATWHQWVREVPQRDASNVATGLMYPTDLASQPLPVLEAAKLRDELLTAVKNGDVSRSESLFQQLPATASANLGLPAGAPDKFLADIGTSAQSHILKFSAPLRVYIAHCSDLSRWHHWVEKNIENQSDAKALFSPGLRDVCHALRTTHESRLAADRLNIEHKIQAVLSDPQLPQTLAQQPFVAIQTMLDKCTVLKSVQGESATLRAFCDALEAAQALQSTAIETLREELLTEVLDRKRLKPVLMMAFAWQMTSAPNENLNAHTTGAQKIKVHDRLQQLLKVALSPANHYDNGWEAAVLRELIRPLK